jgi:hypothetical protein
MGRPRIDPALKKQQPAPYLAADVKTLKKPVTSEVMEKMKYFKWVKFTNPGDEREYYRLFAYAQGPMRAAAWQKLFEAKSVKKIEGYFEEYAPYLKIRDRARGPDCNWAGLAPACRKMAEAPELSELEDSGLEDDEAESMEIDAKDAKPAGPTWMQCVMQWKTPKDFKCKRREEWDQSGSELKLAVEYLAVVEERNADGSFTGFVVCMARAKTPMPVEEWQWLFRCRNVKGMEDARDLGAEADMFDAAGNRVDERGVRAVMLEDGRWIRETEADQNRRQSARGARWQRIYDAGKKVRNEDFDAERAAARVLRAEAESAETERFRRELEERKLASAALAARATLAVRAAWGGKG